jgi:hypothetical protein
MALALLYARAGHRETKKKRKRREAMTIRTQLRAGARSRDNHNETLAVRTALKAGRMREIRSNHNEAMQTRTGLKAGARKNVRASLQTTGRKEDRLDLMVVRAGLRAGKRSRSFGR